MAIFQRADVFSFHYPISERTLPLVIDTILVAPVFEEMFFRYTLIYAGEKKWLRIFTAVVSTVLFALIHLQTVEGNLFALLPFFVLGIYLTIVYLRKKNIFESIFVHAFYNSIVILFAMLFWMLFFCTHYSKFPPYLSNSKIQIQAHSRRCCPWTCIFFCYLVKLWRLRGNTRWWIFCMIVLVK